MSTDNKMIVPLLALGHGLNDLIAGYFLGLLVFINADLVMISSSLVLYNVLAFGGQYPFALWIEKRRQHKKFLVTSYGLNILAIIVFTANPMIAIILAGIGSAIYHVAGGAICAKKEKAFSIGVFAAPGVIGLIIGGYFAWTNAAIFDLLLIAALFFSVLLLVGRISAEPNQTAPSTAASSEVFDRHDLIMILLLTVIALRSAIWNVFQLLHEQEYDWLIAIGLAAAAGKIFGGWLADRIGWRIYVFVSLSVATPLISFFKNDLLWFCIGIGLLQSGIPATTALMIESARGKKERGISLAFGTAIIAGAFVLYMPGGNLLSSPLVLISLVILMLILFAFTRINKASPDNASH